MVPHLTYPEAVIVGLFQGVTELFPVSSLGHSVLIPALVGGSWAQDLSVTRSGSPYLAFIVGLHVATAIAMIIYFWRDWLRIVVGFCTSIAHRRIETVDQKLAWMIVLATIPVGIVGALLQHTVQSTFAKPVLTAVFLAVNGLILFGGERLRRRELAATARPRAVTQETWVAGSHNPALARPGRRMAPEGYDRPSAYDQRAAHDQPGAHERGGAYGQPGADDGPGAYDQTGAYDHVGAYDQAGAHGRPGSYDQPEAYERAPQPGREDRPRAQLAGRHSAGQRAIRQQEVNEAMDADARLTQVGYLRGVLLGALQIFALLPGISRDGVVMVGGMARGLSRQDAARFSFLLSAPVILAAGALKLPELTGAGGDGIRGQVIAGSIASGVAAFLALRFLMRYFQDQTRTLMPFAIYCLVVGIGSAIYLSV
ncbi:MAG: undecaprenyl-diphosphate phosphatase [Streptosporangiaceae bacterium]